MLAILFLILIACLCGAGASLLTAAVVCTRAVFALLDALVQQVPSGVMLFVRLAVWASKWLAKLVRCVWLRVRRIGVWAAQHVHASMFVRSAQLREWYVASELRRRAH